MVGTRSGNSWPSSGRLWWKFVSWPFCLLNVYSGDIPGGSLENDRGRDHLLFLRIGQA